MTAWTSALTPLNRKRIVPTRHNVLPRPKSVDFSTRFASLMWRAGVVLLLSFTVFEEATSAGEKRIVGAGSSLAAPVVETWAAAFAQGHAIDVRFDSVGSGAGIRRLVEGSVDFAVTDVPLVQTDLVRNDLVQYPLVAAAIVPVANVPGIRGGELRLSGNVLAMIFNGEVSLWNAPAVRALNPGLELPNLPIKVIHRSDTSGTTYAFTYYLSKVSSGWHSQVGIGSRINWPAGDGARGNEGVALEVNRAAGAIGYVELNHAIGASMTVVQLSNHTGRFVTANEKSVRAAMQEATFSRPSYYQMIVNQGGAESWPIVVFSYVLLPRRSPDVVATQSALEFLDWIYHRGSPAALADHYVPIANESLVKRIESSFNEFRDPLGRPVFIPR